MSEEKVPYIPAPEDVSIQKLTDAASPKLETSDTEINSSKGSNNSANNSNISRTNLDTKLIDLNADGDADESIYNDTL